MINEKYIFDIRDYIKQKTGILYFKDIRKTENNIIVTCPYHKGGQENKPSATIRTISYDRAPEGMFHCFTCGESKMIPQVVRELLGDLYNEDEVESLFNFATLSVYVDFSEQYNNVQFSIPKQLTYNDDILRKYDYYHEYLLKRGISEDTAKKYCLGYDSINQQITFPIRDINRYCIGIGRRSINRKFYSYPIDMKKPLYGVYELSKKVNFLYVVEGPFNLWSLSQWGKNAVSLLGTGTEQQYYSLSKFDCFGFVLCLDPDNAGRNGTRKIIKYLLDKHRRNIYVAILPEGKDVNDLTKEEFNEVEIVTYKDFWNMFGKEIS